MYLKRDDGDENTGKIHSADDRIHATCFFFRIHGDG